MMKICFYYREVSPHLMPLVREIVNRIGADNVRYVYMKDLTVNRTGLGWTMQIAPWIINKNIDEQDAERWIYESDVLMTEKRDVSIWCRRVLNGKRVYYTSERWHKPIALFTFGDFIMHVPGWLRLLHPRIFKMEMSAARLLRHSGLITYLPDGIHAAMDMVRLLKFSEGKFWYLFKNIPIKARRFPLGEVFLNGRQLNRIRMWGYFVESTKFSNAENGSSGNTQKIRLLWVGRFLRWKRVGDILKALRLICQGGTCKYGFELDLYGVGSDEFRLRMMSKRMGLMTHVCFHSSVPVEQVRGLMREHDVYVLPSNAYEGWGAVINEALEEGMRVVGTYEAGASVTLLPESCLYHAGDWKRLAEILQGEILRSGIGEWNVRNAAQKLLGEFNGNIATSENA